MISIRSNTTVFSEGGYAAKPKYNREALEKISNEIDAILKSREQQRLVSAAKRQAAQSGRAALSGETDPRLSAGAANKPNNPWSAEKKQPVPTGETDPRFSAGAVKPASAQVFAPRQQPEKEEEQKPQGGAALRYATKSDMDKNSGSGMAGLFGGETGNPKNTAASDLNRTKGAGVAAVAGKVPQNYFDKIIEWSRSGESSVSQKDKLLQNKGAGVAAVAGNGEMYDWAKYIKDFFEKEGTFSTPKERDKIMKGEKILNKPSYEESVYNSKDSKSFIPKERDRQDFNESFMETYKEAEQILNKEEFDNNFEALTVASLNRFSATPAKVTSDVLNMAADCIDELTGEEKNAFCDWLRSMDDNSELLDKSERQYSQVDYDNEFINELGVGTSKELVDTASRAFMGGILKMPPKTLSSIYSATEIYNTARENGYSVEEAMGESGAMAAVNKGASFVFDLAGSGIKNEAVKATWGLLKDATTQTNQNNWIKVHDAENESTIESVINTANTLATLAAVEDIVRGAPYLLKAAGKFLSAK